MLTAEYGRRSGSSLKDPAHDSVYRVGVLCTKPGGTAGMNFQACPSRNCYRDRLFVLYFPVRCVIVQASDRRYITGQQL